MDQAQYNPSYGPGALASSAQIGSAYAQSQAKQYQDGAPAAPPRPMRLDLLAGANDENLKNAATILSKFRAVRERLSGSYPEGGEKNQTTAARTGHIGRLEDQAVSLHATLTAIHEIAEHLLGV